MASELILQLQNEDGTFCCEKYINFPSPRSAYIAICYTNTVGSRALADALKVKIIDFIARLDSAFSATTPPCSTTPKLFGDCLALNADHATKLLLAVSDSVSNVFVNESLTDWPYVLLPVLKSGIPVTLQPPFNIPQVAFWNSNISEVIPVICSVVGISDEDNRIFISYKRTDTAALAEQLFTRLHKEGFEVFLDRFSIDPGVNFQNRLYQELADKAMVVFLESPTFLTSKWIQLEIDFAKQYKLGYLAVNIAGSPKILSVDDENRRSVNLNIAAELDIPDLDDLIHDIKRQHTVALYRMRKYLSRNIEVALQRSGVAPTVDSKGFITFRNQSKNVNYRIWPSARPPRLNDYHYTDISEGSDVKIIVGPEFKEEMRERLNSWLAKKCLVEFYNEGQITDLIKLI